MQYSVRLLDYEGNVVDGEVFEAKSKKEAENMYQQRMKSLGIQKCKYDKIVVSVWEFD